MSMNLYDSVSKLDSEDFPRKVMYISRKVIDKSSLEKSYLCLHFVKFFSLLDGCKGSLIDIKVEIASDRN
jgi:hypothetical protein